MSATRSGAASRRVLSVLVLDRPSVLARVATLVSRRGFNIESLAVGPTQEPGKSRVTLVVEADDDSVAQLSAQLAKLVDVVSAGEVSASASRHQLVLVRVRDVRGLEVARGLGLVVEDSVVVLTSADPGAALAALEPYGITVSRGGLVSLP
jgi:acetolactate synthase-1/3 small subunit